MFQTKFEIPANPMSYDDLQDGDYIDTKYGPFVLTKIPSVHPEGDLVVDRYCNMK